MFVIIASNLISAFELDIFWTSRNTRWRRCSIQNVWSSNFICSKPFCYFNCILLWLYFRRIWHCYYIKMRYLPFSNCWSLIPFIFQTVQAQYMLGRKPYSIHTGSSKFGLVVKTVQQFEPKTPQKQPYILGCQYLWDIIMDQFGAVHFSVPRCIKAHWIDILQYFITENREYEHLIWVYCVLFTIFSDSDTNLTFLVIHWQY